MPELRRRTVHKNATPIHSSHIPHQNVILELCTALVQIKPAAPTAPRTGGAVVQHPIAQQGGRATQEMEPSAILKRRVGQDPVGAQDGRAIQQSSAPAAMALVGRQGVRLYQRSAALQPEATPVATVHQGRAVLTQQVADDGRGAAPHRQAAPGDGMVGSQGSPLQLDRRRLG